MPYDDLARDYEGVSFTPHPLRPKLPDLYQFPPTRFVSHSPWWQWWHLLSEVIEIGRALLRSDLQHAAAEAWDVKHSAETLHRILAGKGADVEMARERVLSGCQDRGYYP